MHTLYNIKISVALLSKFIHLLPTTFEVPKTRSISKLWFIFCALDRIESHLSNAPQFNSISNFLACISSFEIMPFSEISAFLDEKLSKSVKFQEVYQSRIWVSEMSLYQRFSTQTAIICRHFATDSSFEVMKLSKCAFERSNQSPQLWRKIFCGAHSARQKSGKKIETLPFLSQKGSNPPFARKLSTGVQKRRCNTPMLSKHPLWSNAILIKNRKILKLAIFGPKWWSKISAAFLEILQNRFPTDFR